MIHMRKNQAIRILFFAIKFEVPFWSVVQVTVNRSAMKLLIFWYGRLPLQLAVIAFFIYSNTHQGDHRNLIHQNNKNQSLPYPLGQSIP